VAALCAWPTNHDLLSTGRGLGRFQFVLCPSGRVSPDKHPAGGHRGPRSRDAGFVGRERLVIRTGYPLIPPAGTVSPHGVETDPIEASARPWNASFPITPQRQQPRGPPLPRIDSRQTEPPRPRERAGVRANGPLFSCGFPRLGSLPPLSRPPVAANMYLSPFYVPAGAAGGVARSTTRNPR